MGKRSAVVELFLGDMGSMQRELRPSTQREDQLTMETKLEQIAVKAVNQLPKSVVRENPHVTFCGSRGRATASGDPVPSNEHPIAILACPSKVTSQCPFFRRASLQSSELPRANQCRRRFKRKSSSHSSHHCSRNTPSTACSSAALISLACPM